MAINEANVRILAGLEDDAVVTLFVTNAQLILDEDLADKGLSEARLDMIGEYLAAHFAYISHADHAGLKSKKMGDASETYFTPGDAAFSGTIYGMQAIALDTSGTLAAAIAGKGLKAEFRVV
jgi:hypothetical protein